MTTKTKLQSGLDLNVPESGRARDAYDVACTATMLGRKMTESPTTRRPWEPARHAVTLHRISGQLHRIAERQCNEDLTCPTCRGDGAVQNPQGIAGDSLTCKACAGEGTTTGRKVARLRRQAKDIAEHYGLRCYFQTDPRGCSLYLIDPGIVPPTDHGIPVDQERWIDSNYTRGFAVARLSR